MYLKLNSTAGKWVCLKIGGPAKLASVFLLDQPKGTEQQTTTKQCLLFLPKAWNPRGSPEDRKSGEGIFTWPDGRQVAGETGAAHGHREPPTELPNKQKGEILLCMVLRPSLVDAEYVKNLSEPLLRRLLLSHSIISARTSDPKFRQV